MTCDAWDVVVVPFPFTDQVGAKRRPALVLSRRAFNLHGHTVLAMITTKKAPAWPGDTPLTEYGQAGLPVPSLVRLKIFTLDNRMILRVAGSLSAADEAKVAGEIRNHLAPVAH